MSSVENKKESRFSLDSLKSIYHVHRFVFREMWVSHRKLMVFTMIFSVCLAIVPYLQRGAEGLLINHITSNINNLSFTTGFILILSLYPTTLLISNVISSLREYYHKQTWREVSVKWEIKLAEKLASLDVATHEKPDFKDKIHVLDDRGAPYVFANFYRDLNQNLLNIISVITASVIVINYNWLVLIVILISTMPNFFIELRFGKVLWSIYQTHTESKRHLWHARSQVDNTAGVQELKVYNTTGFFLGVINKVLGDFYTEELSKDSIALRWKLLAQLFTATLFGFVIFLLIQPVLSGEMQLGTFIFVLGSSMSLQRFVLRFFIDISSQYQDSEILITFEEVMGYDKIIKNNEKAVNLDLEESPEIIFENVSFAYPSDPNNYVLKNFNLRIEKGEKLAIVGINGAGKSTLIKLLCRFYDPTEGSILINGVDLRHIDLDEWYAALALLSQDYQTYKLPVKELVHLGDNKKKFDIDDIKKASKESDASEFIEKWDKAYDQQVGVEFKGGIDPSQGQKQKLALSRALFKNAYITILDEPTAAVDAKAEQQIFNSLEKNLGKDKTLILISHRFSTVRNADKIIVIDGNNIKEEGTHEELLKLNGMYAEMYHVQAKGYKD